MQICLDVLILILLALHVTPHPIPSETEEVKVAKRSVDQSVSRASSDDEFSAILSKFQSGNGVLSVRRAKRTVPHLQAAWTLHIVCKANPHHPRCSQHVAHDNDQDFDIIARYNRRKYRHRRRHSHRH